MKWMKKQTETRPTGESPFSNGNVEKLQFNLSLPVNIRGYYVLIRDNSSMGF